MRFTGTNRPARPNTNQILLGVECLDARVLPAVGVMLAAMPGAAVADSSVAQINLERGSPRIAVAASKIDLVDDQAAIAIGGQAGFGGNLHGVHVDPFGSKPGGTGEGIF
jgi:hypothetical protein